MNGQDYDYICNQLLSIKSSTEQLLEQQFISNLLSIANNMNVPEETRKEALDRALNMMPLLTLEKQRKSNDLDAMFR